jgi:hypothetical protein
MIRHAEVDLLAHALRERGTALALELAAALEEAAVTRAMTEPPGGSKTIPFYAGPYADQLLTEELSKLRRHRPHAHRPARRKVDGLRCAAAPAMAALVPSIVRHAGAALAPFLAWIVFGAFVAVVAGAIALAWRAEHRPRRIPSRPARMTIEVSPTIAAWRRVGEALDEIDVADESGPNLRATPPVVHHHHKEQ